MPKNTSFLAPHPEKIRIFMKRNDGTIARHMTSLGKPGKGFVYFQHAEGRLQPTL